MRSRGGAPSRKRRTMPPRRHRRAAPDPRKQGRTHFPGASARGISPPEKLSQSSGVLLGAFSSLHHFGCSSMWRKYKPYVPDSFILKSSKCFLSEGIWGLPFTDPPEPFLLGITFWQLHVNSDDLPPLRYPVLFHCENIQNPEKCCIWTNDFSSRHLLQHPEGAAMRGGPAVPPPPPPAWRGLIGLGLRLWYQDPGVSRGARRTLHWEEGSPHS